MWRSNASESSALGRPDLCVRKTLASISPLYETSLRQLIIIAPFDLERNRLVRHSGVLEWTMPTREWCLAKAQFAVLFGQRFTKAMA
jgi:hypothetical protein